MASKKRQLLILIPILIIFAYLYTRDIKFGPSKDNSEYEQVIEVKVDPSIITSDLKDIIDAKKLKQQEDILRKKQVISEIGNAIHKEDTKTLQEMEENNSKEEQLENPDTGVHWSNIPGGGKV